MKFDKISTEDLRHMEDKEGLVLQGCGGNPQEWLDGINGMFTEMGILLDGTKFEQVSVFEHDGLTCILYPFENVQLSMGKLAIWRLQTNGDFGGTWLSDYVPNYLGGFIKNAGGMEKPDCVLIGEDGNIFNLAAVAADTLREHGMGKQADEMKKRILASGSYGEALSIIGGYVNITDRGQQEPENTFPEPEEPGRGR